jgi:hypothetical protein
VAGYREKTQDPERERDPLPTTAINIVNEPLTCDFVAWDVDCLGSPARAFAI